MSGGAYGTTSGTRERESRALMEQLMVFSLAEEIEALRQEPQWAGNDKNSRTLAKNVDFRLLLTILHTGASLEEKDGEARASIQLLEGSADLDVDGEVGRIEAGQVAVVDSGRPWTLRATSDCALLVTFAWPLEKAGV